MQPGGRLCPRRAWAVSRAALALATLKYCFSSGSTAETVTAVTVRGLCGRARTSVPFLAAATGPGCTQRRRQRLTGQPAAELLRLQHHAFRDEGAHQLYEPLRPENVGVDQSVVAHAVPGANEEGGQGVRVHLRLQLTPLLRFAQQLGHRPVPEGELLADARPQLVVADDLREDFDVDPARRLDHRVAEVGEHRLADDLQRIERAAGQGAGLFHDRAAHLLATVVDRLQDRLFALEVAVDGAGAEAALLANVLHRRQVVALAGEAGPGGIQNLAAAGLQVGFGYFGHW